MRNASSVKDRLKNYAKRTGRTVQDALTVYILERVLYRISVSRYADDFTLACIQMTLRERQQTLICLGSTFQMILRR